MRMHVIINLNASLKCEKYFSRISCILWNLEDIK